jgi:hypothetical protein
MASVLPRSLVEYGRAADALARIACLFQIPYLVPTAAAERKK